MDGDPGARGIRIRMRDGLPMDADHPGLNRAFAAAAKHGLPVNLLCWGILDKGLPHIQRHRDTVIVIEHLGMLQPARPPERSLKGQLQQPIQQEKQVRFLPPERPLMRCGSADELR